MGIGGLMKEISRKIACLLLCCFMAITFVACSKKAIKTDDMVNIPTEKVTDEIQHETEEVTE